MTSTHSLWHRPKTSDGSAGHDSNLLSPGHKVSFSDSSKGSSNKRDSGRPSSASNSRPQSPAVHSSSPARRPQMTPRQSSNRTERPRTGNFQRINRHSEALWQQPVIPPEAPQPKPFLIYHDTFLTLLGPSPTLQCLIHDPRAPYFHKAGVFHPPTNTLFVTSDQLSDPSPDAVTTRNKTIVVTKLEFFSPTDFTRDRVRCPEHTYMPSGGAPYRDGLLLCAQGSLREPAALIHMEAKRPHKTSTVLNNYHSRPFNSPADAAVHSDGSIWFSDPIYGYELGFRPRPQLPQHLYRFDPASGDIRCVADGLARPAALAFSPDEGTLYVADTDTRHGDSALVPTRPATIYAFSLYWAHSSPSLINKRVFAYVDTGAPDGLAVDMDGNVYAACGDGVNVWGPGGGLIGKVQIEGGVAGLCFGRNGELWAFGGERLWRVGFGPGVKGAVLGI